MPNKAQKKPAAKKNAKLSRLAKTAKPAAKARLKSAALGKPKAAPATKAAVAPKPKVARRIKTKAKAPLKTALLAPEAIPPEKPISQPAPMPSAPIAWEPEVPAGYGEDRLELLVRDPWWIYAYWELTSRKLGADLPAWRPQGFDRAVLRLHDVTDLEYKEGNSHFHRDFDTHLEHSNFYLPVWEPNRDYLAELGWLDQAGNFHVLLRSRPVRVPRAAPSETWGEDWASLDEAGSLELFRLSGGLSRTGSSSPLGGSLGPYLSSPGFNPNPWQPASPHFFLRVETLLIVRGATLPDARLSVNGRVVPLREDGTFSLQFELPDGEQHHRVEAISADYSQRQSASIVVRRNRPQF